MRKYVVVLGCIVGGWWATACSPEAKQEGGEKAQGNERGKQVYTEYCSTCHMATGKGMQGVYPPLAKAEFLRDKEKTIHAVTNGLQGEITVHGERYNNVMPPVPGSFSNADIAEVINYVVSTFGDSTWTTTEQEIAAIRKR